MGERGEVDEIGKFIAENPTAAVIAAGEAGFWVLIAARLAARYGLRARRTSAVLLALVPLIDLEVLVAAAADLAGGAKANFTHGLAAVYLGFSVVFGPSLVRWADVRFAHRFAGGPAPQKAPKHGPERVAHLMREWYRVLGTVTVASAVLVVMILFFAAPEDQAGLWSWIGRAWVIVGLWFVFGPLWERGKSALSPQPQPEPVGGVTDDAQLFGDLDRCGASPGVAGIHRSVDGEHLTNLRR